MKQHIQVKCADSLSKFRPGRCLGLTEQLQREPAVYTQRCLRPRPVNFGPFRPIFLFHRIKGTKDVGRVVRACWAPIDRAEVTYRYLQPPSWSSVLPRPTLCYRGPKNHVPPSLENVCLPQKMQCSHFPIFRLTLGFCTTTPNSIAGFPKTHVSRSN